MSFLLALLLANPSCCCFGKWLAQLTLAQPVAASCCADSEPDEEPATPQDHRDCACKTTQVTQAKPAAEQLSQAPNPPVAKLSIEAVSMAALPPKSVAQPLLLDSPSRSPVPARLAYQVFLL